MSKLILSTEDEPAIQALIADILTDEGYTVVYVHAEDLARRVRTDRPALVLLDLLTPGICGAHAAAAVRTEFQATDVPIVVITAFVEAAKTYEEIGAQALISKPFVIDELVQAVARFAGPA